MISLSNTFAMRLKYASRWALLHLAVSAVVALISAVVVFGLWYPQPWRQMLGVTNVFFLVVIADVICGPLLTLILVNPRKSIRERWLDVSLIGLIQIVALAYGLFSVFSARPVILAFEVDRFVVITANEVQIEDLPKALPELQTLPWFGVTLVALRPSANTEDYLLSLEETINGVSQPMRPGWWRPYKEAKTDIAARALPLISLLNKRPDRKDVLTQAITSTGLSIDQLQFLPLTSTKRSDWVALLNLSGEIVGSVNVDGFF